MKALGYFPELRDLIESNCAPLDLWGELFLVLQRAYDDPINEVLIGTIYDYAQWCFSEPNTENIDTDLPNAVAIGFIESLPLDQRISQDLFRWLSVETFDGLENLFRYHLSDAEYRKFSFEFLEQKKKFSGQPRL
jgi:hypothetical protein